MSAAVDLSRYARRKSIELTTIGRRSHQPRAVTVWFVLDGPNSLLVQHVAAKPANWYRNLSANPEVTVDFGDGPLAAEARVIEDREQIREVVAKVGKKYWTYRVIRFFGGGADEAVAARITLKP